MGRKGKIATYFGLRIVILAIAIVGFNAIYKTYFWTDYLKENAVLLPTLLEAKENAEVIYIAESSDMRVIDEDSIKLVISEFTDRYFNDLKVASVHQSAYHGSLYRNLLSHIEPEDKVETVVITLNLRTLDAACIHGKFETGLQKQNTMYRNNPPLLNRVSTTLNFYDNTPDHEREKRVWKEWIYDTLKSEVVDFPAPNVADWCALTKFPLPEGGEDMEKRTLADHYVKAYAFQIDTLKNPRIADFDAMVADLQSKGKNVVLNLLAENVEYADSLVGEPLVWLMKQNRNLLVERYTKKGAIVVDNLTAVKGDDFVDRHWTTEHYNQVGRQIIARNVAEALKRLHPKATYVEQPILR